MSNILCSWQFDSKKSRWATWYIVVLSIAIWLIIWWFLSKQFWMSFVIIILIWLVFYIENNWEDIVWVNIIQQWIKIWSSFYSFSEIKNYRIIYENENAVLLKLNLLKKVWIVSIDINIDNTIVVDIKNILINFIEEKTDRQLTFIEKMMRILKI